MMKKSLSIALLIMFIMIVVLSYSSTPSDDQPNPLLLVSVDGFMNEYLYRNDTPNFDRLLEKGVQAEYLIPVFPTKTFPTHFSIVTGLYVENHGIISNRFYDYELDERFAFGPQGLPNDERWWGGEPIWITAEKQGRTATTFFWPGSEASFNGVQPTRWVDYDDAVPDHARIDSVMSWLDRSPSGDLQADFSTLYFSFVDRRAHSYGKNSPEVDEAVLEMDLLLGYLLEQMEEKGLSEELNVILVSDHGMADLSEDKLIFLEEIINLEDVDVVDWTPVSLIRPNEGKKEEVYQSLKAAEAGYQVYKKEDLPDRFHFSNHYRIPEIVIIADVGYTITTRQNFEQRGIIAATHGYDNLAPEMRTFFAASGPDFISGQMVEPFEAIHIYELMARLLNLDSAPNDGDPDALHHLLKD
jgi:predicted AlkP superfamily pyrophosphatase or phosphodiesterase